MPTSFNAAGIARLTDSLTALWLTLRGTDAAGYGAGLTQVASGLYSAQSTARAVKKAENFKNLVRDSEDDITVLLLPKAMTMLRSLDAFQMGNAYFGEILSEISARIQKLGLPAVTDLDTFATYYNRSVGGPWNCLLAPDFRELYAAWRSGAQPTSNTYAPSAGNVYFEVLQGASYTPYGIAANAQTYTDGLGKFVFSGAGAGTLTDAANAPTQSDGSTGPLIAGSSAYGNAGSTGMIDPAKYAGGIAYLKWSGVTGSGTVTVRGVWRNPDASGTTAVDNGTVAVSGASGEAVITPPSANQILLDVISFPTPPAGISAGTLYAEARRPSGRTNPPT